MPIAAASRTHHEIVPRRLRIPLGEMSVLLTEGRFARTNRLLELGFQFQFGSLQTALQDLLQKKV